MKRRALPSVLSWLAPVFALAACDDFPPKGWFIDRTRVLGARVEAAGDPDRASVAPGERATLGWRVATAAGTPAPRLGWSFATCPRPSGNFADPRCEDGALSTGSGTSNPGPVVSMPFEVPPTGADELLVLAAFCPDVLPEVEPRTFGARCSNGVAPLLASTLVALRTPNKNPVLADDVVRVDGAVIPPSAPGAPCASLVPVRGVGHDLQFRFAETQREPEETLTLSHFVASGDLERQYSVLERGAPATDAVVRWDAPSAPVAGVPVELHFVLRDGRGGLAFARRSVCALP